MDLTGRGRAGCRSSLGDLRHGDARRGRGQAAGTGLERGEDRANDLCAVHRRRAGDLVGYVGAPRFAGGYHPHHGQDVLCRYGAPILAVDKGSLRYGDDPLGGRTVSIDREDAVLVLRAPEGVRPGAGGRQRGWHRNGDRLLRRQRRRQRPPRALLLLHGGRGGGRPDEGAGRLARDGRVTAHGSCSSPLEGPASLHLGQGLDLGVDRRGPGWSTGPLRRPPPQAGPWMRSRSALRSSSSDRPSSGGSSEPFGSSRPRRRGHARPPGSHRRSETSQG